MNDDRYMPQRKIAAYGETIAEYTGTGVATFHEGWSGECDFTAGQITDGTVWLLCDFISPPPYPLSLRFSLSHFEGMTRDKAASIRAEGFTPTNYLPDQLESERPYLSSAYRVRELDISLAQTIPSREIRFGLTNFLFSGTEPRLGVGDRTRDELRLELQTSSGLLPVRIIAQVDYDQIVRRLRTLKGFGITCEAIVDVPSAMDVNEVTVAIGDLCALLSVARGSKVQWIYRDLYGEDGTLLSSLHSSRITKRYNGMAVIDPRSGFEAETKSFVENAFPVFTDRKQRFRLLQGTIDAYLDAKAEHDYLELRGVKMAVSMECVKDAYLQQLPDPAPDSIIAAPKFAELQEKIKAAIDQILQDNGINAKHTREQVRSKVTELNRRSFRSIMRKLCAEIDFQPTPMDLSLFIACRNKLVHTGQFFCRAADENERKITPPLAGPREEYFFMTHFMDRLFLRLLGYHGTYLDWSVPGNPTRQSI